MRKKTPQTHSPVQLGLDFRPASGRGRGWGGARAGAGRPRHVGRARHVVHLARPAHSRRCPVHVTLRRGRGLPSFRAQVVVAELERSLARASTSRYRVVHYSVQADHVHLLIEAVDRQALSRGTQGLAIRLARTFNRVVRRRGKVWGDRFFARELHSPREVRAAIVYVLMNHKKHDVACAFREQQGSSRHRTLDPYSSAAWFDGFTQRAGPLLVRLRDRMPTLTIPILRPRTWLLRQGWRRHGLIAPDERPRLG